VGFFISLRDMPVAIINALFGARSIPFLTWSLLINRSGVYEFFVSH